MESHDTATQTQEFLADCDVRIDASPETVFEFFVDADKIVLWMGVRAELDPRPGGALRIWVSETWIASGAYTEIDRPSSVSFTWGWENDPQVIPPGSSLVRVTLEPDDGATIVRLRHSGLPSEEAMRSHRQGWQHYLSRLQVSAAGGDPGPDPWAAGTGDES